jgi:hypothetical protein
VVTTACGSVAENRDVTSGAAASGTTSGTAGISSTTGSGFTSGVGGASAGVGGSNGTGGIADCTAPQISVLAPDQTAIHGIAFDDANVYWSNFDVLENQGQIRRISKAGGPVVVISNITKLAPEELAVDGTQVYWYTRGSADLNGVSYPEVKVYSVPKGGGNSPKKELASVFNARGTGLALDSDRVYWSTTDDRILSVPKGGNAGPTTVLAQNSGFNLARRSVAVDADRAYWMEGAVDILSIPKSGGAMPTVLATLPPDAVLFTTDAKRIYWGDISLGHVSSMPKGGGAPKVLVSGEDQVLGIAVNSSCVYWIASAGNQLRVRAASKNGGPATTIAPLVLSTSYVVVADETHLYWEDLQTHSLMQATK